MSNINLDIINFGPINKANIELKKLNVIAGVNGSGKTTSSKLLYCFLTSNSDEKEYLSNISINERFVALISDLYSDAEFDSETSDKLEKLFARFPALTDKTYNTQLKKCISSLKKIINESKLKNKDKYVEKLDTIEYALEVNSIEPRKFFDVSNVLLKSEFKLKDLKFEDTYVQLYGKQDGREFSYKLDSIESKLGFIIDKGDLNCLNIKNIIYIDSPSIFNSEDIKDIIILKNQPYHLKSLSKLLNTPKNNEDINDELFNQKLDHFRDKITLLLGGFIYYDDDEEEFKFKTGDESYSMKNTASGVKQLGIIQMLLSNRTLSENSFLIMDEPEVNLHPTWQVKLAEILVLLVKDLNVNLFINSHSPQFIEAMEVYSIKYGLRNETNFYLTQKDKNGGKYNVEKIEYKKLYELYDDLGDPYKTISKIRGQNLARHL